jgi:uncharacterized protein (TIGR03437 family)
MGIRRLAALPLVLLTWTALQAQPERRVVLAGRVHPQARAENDRGAVDSSFPLTGMTLLLKRSAGQQAGLSQLLEDQRNPASASFHRWLSPEQFATRFGLDTVSLNTVTAWLSAQGFTNVQVSRSHTFVTFDGTAGQVQSAMSTAIHRYQVNGRTHFANAASPSLPASVADVTGSILGLHDFHLQPRIKTPSHPEAALASGTHHITPDDFATIYDVAPLYAAGVNGTGQQIAVVGQTDINMSDIQAFRTKFNLSAPNVQQMKVPTRPDPGTSSGDLPEADLDIEWSGAVARNATIIYVYSDDVIQSLIYAVDQNVAPVVSMSYGGCEQQDLVDLPSYQAVAQQANAQGMTVLAAAGDSGAGDCEDQGVLIAQDGFAVDVPGSIPEVTSMGGTVLNDQGGSYWSSSVNANGASALSYIPELAWNDTPYGFGLAASGGGTSVYFTRPYWQTAPGLANDGARHVPDLALSASADHDGYFVYTSGQGAYYGGTSVAAPSMAGIVGLLNHYLTSTGIHSQPGLGNINPALYRLAQSSPGAFHDVTGGNNNVPCANGTPNCTKGTFGVSAGVGYDSVTGLGSVDAANLAHQWSTKPPANSAVVVSIDQNPVFQQNPDAAGNPWHFTLTLTEEAGAATTLTAFTVDGVSYTSQIAALFRGAGIPAGGSLTATMGLKNVAVPKSVTFGFSGVDASGITWSQQISIPFQGPQARLSVGGMSNAASGQQVFAPGMIVSIYGAAMGNFAQAAAAVPLTNYLAGFEATVNGVAAPLYYVSPNQVNIQIPYETQPGRATLTVGNPYENVNYNFRVTAAGPGIFTFADGSINPSRSGSRGQVVTLFVTGDGQVTPSLSTGSAPSASTPLARLPKPQQPVIVTVGGVPATVQFIGIPSGLVGVTQINFTIPASVSAGVQPVVVTVGSVPSNTASLTVQ